MRTSILVILLTLGLNAGSPALPLTSPNATKGEATIRQEILLEKASADEVLRALQEHRLNGFYALGSRTDI